MSRQNHLQSNAEYLKFNQDTGLDFVSNKSILSYYETNGFCLSVRVVISNYPFVTVTFVYLTLIFSSTKKSYVNLI